MKALESATEIVTLIIGVAIVAVVVSKSSNTSGVVQSFGSAVSSILKVAVSPVTGSN